MVIPRQANSDFYASDLAGAMSGPRLFDPDYALAQDPEIYEKLRKYPAVAGALHLRKLMVSGSDYYLEPASANPGDIAAVPLFEGLLNQVQSLSVAKYNLAEAIPKGSSWAAMQGEYRALKLPQCPLMRWYCVTGLTDVDKRRMRQIHDQDLEPGEYRWYLQEPVKPHRSLPINREHFVHLTYGTDESSLGYGRGLVEAILYPFWYVSSLDEHAAQYGERWAQGFRIWKLGTIGAPLTTDKRTQYLNLVDTFVSRYAAVVDAVDDFQLVDAPANALEYISKRQDRFDALIRFTILGSTMMTDPKSEGGSYAVGDAQFKNTTQLMTHHDRGVMDEALTHDLLGFLWRANFENFRELGLETTGPAKFHTKDLQQHDPAKRFPVFEAAQRLGLALKLNEVYQDLELTPPTPGEPVIAPPANPAPGPVGRPGDANSTNANQPDWPSTRDRDRSQDPESL